MWNSHHCSTLGLETMTWLSWYVSFLSKWFWIQNKWLVVQIIENHLYTTCLEMLTHGAKFCIMPLWNLEHKREALFTFLAFHKQRWQRKGWAADLLFHFIPEHAIWQLAPGLRSLGYSYLDCFTRNAAQLRTYLGTVGSARITLLGRDRLLHGIWDNPQYVPVVTLTFSHNPKCKWKYFSHIALQFIPLLNIIEWIKANGIISLLLFKHDSAKV